MRRTLFAGLTVVLALAACTSGDDDSSSADGTTTTVATGGTAAPIEDARAPGVTDDEILVGVNYVDFTDQLRDITGFDHGDYEAAYQAEIDAVNAAGGVNGRDLRVVFSPVDPLGSDGAAAACTLLTQDEQVFVVMGFFLGDSVSCYLETHPTAVIGGAMTQELLDRATVPWYTTEPSQDAAGEAVTAMADAGKLDGTVAVVGVSGDEALYEGSIAPALEEAGITPVDVAYIDTSVPDTNAVTAAAQTVAERFSADGADQVLLIGTASGGTFPAGLARTDYRPVLAFADLNSALTYSTGETNDLSVLEGSVTAGGFDASSEFPNMGGATAECVQRQEAAGLELIPLNELPEGASQQQTSSLQACRNVALLVAILEAAGPDLNYGTFQTAGNSLGDIELAGDPSPFHFGAPPSADGDPALYVYEWDGTEYVRQDS